MTVTIYPHSASNADVTELAQRLLGFAAADPSVIETDTSGDRIGFRVPDEIAEAAGYDLAEPAEPATDGTEWEKLHKYAEPVSAPDRNAKTVEWQEFLRAQGIEFADSDTRTALLAKWDARSA